MIRNKKLTYGLLGAVLVVWGFIAYRISASISKPPVHATGSEQAGSFGDEGGGEDLTFQLTGNYRDPFLGTPVTVKPVLKPEPAPKARPAPEGPVNWNFITYHGMIMNQKTGGMKAILRISGRENILREQQVAEEVEVIAIYRDSVNVIFKNEKKNIVLSANTPGL